MKMMAKSLLLLSAAFLLTVASPVENEFREIESRQETVNYRLGEEIFPTKYELYITPYFVDVISSNFLTFIILRQDLISGRR